jgi:biotin carboxyl carrier protein
MNGRVVAVLVKPGEQVTAGQPVMTLEAMKMEHVHTAAWPARCRPSMSPRVSR